MSGVHGIAYKGGIEEVVTAHRLCAAAAHLAERAGSSGTPHSQRAFVRAGEELDFDDLARSLARNEWTPGPLSPIMLARQGGRLVHSASVVDRIVDRAVATAIAPVVDPLLSPLVFAYRKGLGVRGAIDALVEFRDDGIPFVVRSDIRSCFDSVNVEATLQRLSELCPPEMVALVALLLVGRRTPPAVDVGLPQGLAVAPVLANLALDPVDRSMAAQGLQVVRFADDLAVPVASEAEGQAALAVLEQVVHARGFRLSPIKTQFHSFANGVPFLGQTVLPTTPSPDVDLEDDRGHRTLYVSAQGAGIRVDRSHVLVRRNGTTLLDVPTRQVERVVLLGAVGLSAGARSHLLSSRTPTTFLTHGGRWMGSLDSGAPSGARRRRSQVAVTDDEERCLEFGRASIAGKIANQRALLLRYARRDRIADVSVAADRLDDFRGRVLTAESVASARGVEGAAARRYFAGLRLCIPSGLGFRRRIAHPPKGGVNAALSLGYGMLRAEVSASLRLAGLDPAFSFVHDEGIPEALALDLMEEFRPLVVDSLVVGLLRRRTLTRASFVETDDGTSLKGPALRGFLGSFERRMMTRVAHVPSGTTTSYRRCLALQARQISRFIEHGEAYVAMPWR